MIPELVAVALSGLFCWTTTNAADRAVKGAARSVKRNATRVGKDVAHKAALVLQPCAHGLAPHTPTIERDYGTKVCRVCSQDLP